MLCMTADLKRTRRTLLRYSESSVEMPNSVRL